MAIKKSPSFHALRMQELSMAVHLGCTAGERAVAQEIRVLVELRFAEAPLGTRSDQLQDTVCYARMAEVLFEHCRGREFQLIERMAYEFYGLIRDLAGPSVTVAVRVHKVRPPVQNLLGGTAYSCGDFAL